MLEAGKPNFMKFNKHELKRIRQALYTAIDTEEAFIDAHRTKTKRVKGRIILVIPKEHKSLIAQTRRTIASWQKILKSIETELTNPEGQ